jgi:hypothetical protein
MKMPEIRGLLLELATDNWKSTSQFTTQLNERQKTLRQMESSSVTVATQLTRLEQDDAIESDEQGTHKRIVWRKKSPPGPPQ